MRIWFDTQRLTSLNLAPSDITNAIQSQNNQAADRPHRRPPGARRPSNSAQSADPGPSDDGGAVRRHRASRQPGRLEPQDQGCRARRTRRAERGHGKLAVNGKPAVAIGIYLSPGANAVSTAAAVTKTLNKLKPRFPRRLEDDGRLRHDDLREGHDRRGASALWSRPSCSSSSSCSCSSARCAPRSSRRSPCRSASSAPSPSCCRSAIQPTPCRCSRLVLAIGIVVDDAIVVVENVERVMEEEPELSTEPPRPRRR